MLTQMNYKRGNTLVRQRVYTYDALGRPLTRQTSRNGQTVNDSFVHMYRSELASVQVNGQTYAYDYDNIGNRRMSIDASDYAFYDANEPSYYDKIILLTHSRGYYNNYTILIDKDVYIHSSELPKNIEVLGCHLYGKLNKREKIEGGTKSNIVSILQILDDLLFKRLSKYTAKENCEITYKIGLLTTTIKSYHIPNDVVKNPHTI